MKGLGVQGIGVDLTSVVGIGGDLNFWAFPKLEVPFWGGGYI